MQRYINFMPTTTGSSSLLFPRLTYHAFQSASFWALPKQPSHSPLSQSSYQSVSQATFPLFKVSFHLHLCLLEELPSPLSVKATLRGTIPWQQSLSSQRQNPAIFLFHCADMDSRWLVNLPAVVSSGMWYEWGSLVFKTVFFLGRPPCQTRG